MILYSVFALLKSRGLVTKENMEAGTGNAWSFQHSGDGESFGVQQFVQVLFLK